MHLLARMTRVGIVVVTLAACGRPPPAMPTKAEATRGLVVCWRERPDEIGEEAYAMALRSAIRARLGSAGYTLASRGCDLHVSWRYTTKSRGGDTWYHTAALLLRDRKDETLDVVRFELERDHFPVEEPDRLAILFVNSVNASPKIVRYATELRGGGAPR